MGGDDILAIDEPTIAGLRSAFSLVNDRLVKAHLAGRIAQQQIAVGVNAEALPRPQRGRFNLKSNGARIGARIDYKIVFELPLVAVIDQVNAVIDILVFDFGVVGDIGMPLRGIVANEIVAPTLQLIEAANAYC